MLSAKTDGKRTGLQSSLSLLEKIAKTTYVVLVSCPRSRRPAYRFAHRSSPWKVIDLRDPLDPIVPQSTLRPRLRLIMTADSPSDRSPLLGAGAAPIPDSATYGATAPAPPPDEEGGLVDAATPAPKVHVEEKQAKKFKEIWPLCIGLWTA